MRLLKNMGLDITLVETRPREFEGNVQKVIHHWKKNDARALKDFVYYRDNPEAVKDRCGEGLFPRNR